MTSEEALKRLRELPRGERQAVADKTGLTYGYLSKIAVGVIESPSARQIDKLRAYFERRGARA